ncbi:hypothetical protein QBC41DRAFT_300599 [Cercophora samala]|uniref:Uncharacterized protein n=1 Tax=Cercophora samala TaxID=330535 RepID=A0AA39ZI01_9PEZI|nr:hypothetical protein QBC41DRAFT_300599 [Cercophora samala]
MCHNSIVTLGCGHKSDTLSSFTPCRRLRKLQRDEDSKIRLFSRHKKLADCGNVTSDRRHDDSRVCGSCYDKQKQELRAQREREQRAEARRIEQRSEILRNRVEQDRREREKQERRAAERKKGMERDARRQKAEMEEDARRRERRAYREEMARKREEEERKKQLERRARAERAEREARERRERERRREREAMERAHAEAERKRAAERIAAREREERKRREEKERMEREAREKKQRDAERARRTAASSSRRPVPPPGRLSERRFLSPAAEAQRQQQLRNTPSPPSRPSQRGSAAVPPLRIPTRQTRLPVHRNGPQRPVQVVSPIPMHFAQAASIHGGTPPMDRSGNYYGPGPSRNPVNPVDDIINMYQQRSPTVDISEPFNPGFKQAQPTNPNLNRNPGRHIGLGIYVPSSSQQPSGLRRYIGRPQRPSEHVLDRARDKGKGKESRIPTPSRRKVTFDTSNKPDRSRPISESSSSSGDSRRDPTPPRTYTRDRNHRPRDSRSPGVSQAPDPMMAHIEAIRHLTPSNNSRSSIRNVLGRLTSRRSHATPSPIGRMAHRVSGTFHSLAGRKSPPPQEGLNAREAVRWARESSKKSSRR